MLGLIAALILIFGWLCAWVCADAKDRKYVHFWGMLMTVVTGVVVYNLAMELRAARTQAAYWDAVSRTSSSTFERGN